MSDSSFERISIAKSLRHVTIRQVLNALATSDKFCIDDQETSFVVVIANVCDINYNGSRLTYGLDDGTGRIKAYMWDVGTEEGEVETMRHRQPFQYVRATGEINQFRGLFSLRLEATSFVKDPHEIYHHLLRVMLETVIYRRGPPNLGPPPDVAESRKDPLSMQSLHDGLSGIYDGDTEDPPVSGYNSRRIGSTHAEGSPREREPQREGRAQSPKSIQLSPTRVVDANPVHRPWSQPYGERGFRYDNTSRDAPGGQGNPLLRPEPLTEPTKSERSPISTPERRLHLSRGSKLQHGERAQSSKSIKPSSTRTVDASAAHSPWSQPKNDERNFRYENTPTVSTSRNQGNLSLRSKPPTEPIKTEPSPASTPERRIHDPYSHLSNLHRDIILTVQNILLSSEDSWRGISLAVLAKAIVKRHPYLKHEQLLEALQQLVDEGYLYNTIDDNTFACT